MISSNLHHEIYIKFQILFYYIILITKYQDNILFDIRKVKYKIKSLIKIYFFLR